MDPQPVAADAPVTGAPPPIDGAAPQPTAGDTGEPTQDTGKASSPPTDVQGLHAGFTRKSMALASIRDELGLPKSTPDAQILDAVRALRQPRGVEAITDPELAQQYARLDEQRWTLVERTYGREIADPLRQLRDVAMTTGDPEEMAAAFWEAVQAYQAVAQPAPAAPAAAAAAPQAQPEPEVEIGDGDDNILARRRLAPDITEGLGQSGDTLTAARRIFGKFARTS